MPLLASQRYHPHRSGELSFGEDSVRRRHPLPGLFTPGTTRSWLLRGTHQRIGSGMLLQKPAGEFLAQGTGLLLPLRERHQFVGRCSAEHLVKGSHCLLDPLPPHLRPFARTERFLAIHSRCSCQRVARFLGS
jgi:hypothetical protein